MVKISQIFFTTSEKFSLWQHLVSVLTGPLICFHYYYYTVVFLYRNVDITSNGSYSHKTLSDYLLLNSNQAGWGGNWPIKIELLFLWNGHQTRL